MKDLRPRGEAPVPLADNAAAHRQAWYEDLRDAHGEIRPRWRTNRHIQAGVRGLTSERCAWCGRPGGVTTDHYLPKEAFPRLAYCWENLLPSCHFCNEKRKRDYVPPGLVSDSLVDPALAPGPNERAYAPDQILPALPERLVDPSFEDPAQHLRFDPMSHGYTALTRVGEVTRGRFFDEKEDAEAWEKLSASVRWHVEHASSDHDLQEGLRELEALVGSGFYIDEYARFWRGFFSV